jgi:hypothetical protein
MSPFAIARRIPAIGSVRGVPGAERFCETQPERPLPPYRVTLEFIGVPKGIRTPVAAVKEGQRAIFKTDRGCRRIAYLIEIEKFGIHRIPPLSSHIHSV